MRPSPPRIPAVALFMTVAAALGYGIGGRPVFVHSVGKVCAAKRMHLSPTQSPVYIRRSAETTSGPKSPLLAPGSVGEPDSPWVGLRMPDTGVRPDENLVTFVRYLTETDEGRFRVRVLLERSAQYRPELSARLRDEGVPEDLIAVAYAESGFDPTLRAKKGAAGAWQLTATVARRYGLVVSNGYDERLCVSRATGAAARYLGDLRQQYGSWELAIAAYHEGEPSAAADEPSRGGSRAPGAPGVDLSESGETGIKSGSREELTVYVPFVMGLAVVLKNLERYSLDEPQHDAFFDTSEIRVRSGARLDAIARASGTSVADLRAINPEILADPLPQDPPSFDVHIPGEGLARAKVMLPHLLGTQAELDDEFDTYSAPRPPSQVRAHARADGDSLPGPISGHKELEPARVPLKVVGYGARDSRPDDPSGWSVGSGGATSAKSVQRFAEIDANRSRWVGGQLRRIPRKVEVPPKESAPRTRSPNAHRRAPVAAPKA